jgi:xylulokinase
MMWWRDNEPEIFRRIYKFTVPAVYVAGKFAGLKGDDAFYDYTYATFTGMFYIHKMRWSEEIADALNLPAR